MFSRSQSHDDTHHRYRGHRSNSFYPQDNAETVELRARQRTFDGAYARTAIGNMAYALLIVKLFNVRFYKFGILYGILALMLFILSYIRGRHSRHDFSDAYRDQDKDEERSASRERRIFGRPFITAGWIVLAVTNVVAIVEIGLFVLILALPLN